MADDFLSSGKPCNDSQMHSLKRTQGAAASEPGQGSRRGDSGTGTASPVNSQNTLPPLFGNAKEEPNQGPRDARSGAGGTARLGGRGTMEQK